MRTLKYVWASHMSCARWGWVGKSDDERQGRKRKSRKEEPRRRVVHDFLVRALEVSAVHVHEKYANTLHAYSRGQRRRDRSCASLPTRLFLQNLHIFFFQLVLSFPSAFQSSPVVDDAVCPDGKRALSTLPRNHNLLAISRSRWPANSN